MEIKTKYSIGDTVWIPITGPAQRVVEECPACKGKGSIIVDGNEFKCMKCNGYKEIAHYVNSKTMPTRTTVGQVRTEHTINKEPLIQYMLKATGISSGTVWRENQIFDNREDCIKECEKIDKTYNSINEQK